MRVLRDMAQNSQIKKVLFCITKGNFGGAQRYVYDLATSLPKDQFEAMVAFGVGEKLEENLKEAGIRTERIERLAREVSFFDEFKVCKTLIDLFRKERPDVIHLNSSKIGGIGAVAGRIASLLEKGYKPRIIFTAHGWGFYEKHRSFLSRMFYYASHWTTVMLCDQTIAVSSRTRRDISHLPFLSNKITLIHNGIDDFDTLGAEEARNILIGEKKIIVQEINDDTSETKHPEKRTIMLSIAELHRNKGIDVALRALTLLPEKITDTLLYCIAGEGEERQNLEILIEKLGLKEKVRLLGFVKDAKNLLSGADTVLIPSRTENLPYTILEAGLKGLPIIATSVGGIPEVLKDMQSGILVHKNNPNEIAEGIKYLFENPERKKEFAENIAETVKENFSKQKMLEQTMTLYTG